MTSGHATQSSCLTVWLTSFYRRDVRLWLHGGWGRVWISHSERRSEQLPPKRTHDSVGCTGGWGVSCVDKRRSACAAAVEAGHGRKTAIDVWRHGVRGVTLQCEKNRDAHFFSTPFQNASTLLVCVPGLNGWFIRIALIFSSESTQTGEEQKLTGEGSGVKDRAASAVSPWRAASWRQAGWQDQIKQRHKEGQRGPTD